MAKGLVDMILDSIFDEKWVGKRGEKLTERELKLVKLLGRKGKTLRNVYIPKENGETSEIDVMYITQKGIFVFESKNYSGWIFGDEKGTYWTAMLPNKQKNSFYNPVKQNRTHLKWLQKYVGESIPLFSIIVFSERCELKKVEMVSSDVKVIKRDRTYATVRDIWDSHEDAVSDEEVETLYENLKKLTNVDDAVKAAHIANIQTKYSGRPKKEERLTKDEKMESKVEPSAEPIETKEATEQPEAKEIKGNIETQETKETQETQETQETEESDETTQNQLVCPRCGKVLVLRTAKKGDNAGKQFYGCSGFPKCRYVKNLES